MSRSQRWIRFACLVSVLGVLWLVLLPRVAEVPAVRQRIERQQQAGIEPGAVFYTEHPSRLDWERSMQQRIRASQIR